MIADGAIPPWSPNKGLMEEGLMEEGMMMMMMMMMMIPTWVTVSSWWSH